MTFILNNIRSAWNVGSIFRTCDAIGADVVLIGYTSKPVGKTEALIKKTAIGAEKTVKWQHFEHEQEALAHFANRLQIGIEITKDSLNIYDYLNSKNFTEQQKSDACYWLGNEIHGLSEDLCSKLDCVVHLPMKGLKESLNVANTMCATGYLVMSLEK